MREIPGFPPGGHSYACDLKPPFFGGKTMVVLPVLVQMIWIWTAGLERWFDNGLLGRLAK